MAGARLQNDDVSSFAKALVEILMKLDKKIPEKTKLRKDMNVFLTFKRS